MGSVAATTIAAVERRLYRIMKVGLELRQRVERRPAGV
jgi:hypothetical protein